MPDMKKVIKGLEICSEHGSWHGLDCKLNEAYKDCPYRGCETGCIVTIAKDAIELLKDQEIGHWIFLTDCSNSGVYCSECNTKVFDSYPFKKKLSYFCPHCWTRMEGEIERR